MTVRQSDIYIKPNDCIELTVVGYRNKGESIILNIANQFIGIIDSYRTKKQFITKDILDKIGKKINFICWTHTDEDHTKGLSELLPFVTAETAFILPDSISCNEIRNSCSRLGASNEYKKLFDHIHNISPRYFVAANEHVKLIYEFNLRVLGENTIYKVNLDAFAPMSLLPRQNLLKSVRDIIVNNKSSHQSPNLYSVGLRLVVTKDSKEAITFCFTGDLDNITVNEMDPVALNQIFAFNDLLKIPHHGSVNCNSLHQRGIIRKFDHAAVTSFRGRRVLPDPGVLSDYCNIGKVSFTGQNSGAFGAIHYKLPIHFNRGQVDVVYSNAAGQV